MTVFRPDQKDIRFDAQLQGHPLYVREWEPVRNWLARFREAAMPVHYYELHRELFARFYSWQQFEDECRKREQELREEIDAAHKRGASADEFTPLSQELKTVKLAGKVSAGIRAIYRDLADALVWRLLRYRRPVIAALGTGTVVGRLSDEGLETELTEIQSLWEQHEVVAVHADITSCVRHGDILAFPSLHPLRISITESKKSGKFNQDSAQAQRLKQLRELLDVGAHQQAGRGQPLHFLRPGIAYATYHAELRRLLARARTSTYDWRLVDAGLALEVWDEANPACASRDENSNRHAKMRDKLGWLDDFDTITASVSLRRLRNRRLDHNFASLAPLALTPLALDDTTDLIFGRIDFITTLQTSALEQRLNERGIVAQVARGDGSSNSLLHAERKHVSAMVPVFVREQVQVELMRLDTLAATVDWFLDNAAERGKAQSADLFYEDEAGVWESAV